MNKRNYTRPDPFSRGGTRRDFLKAVSIGAMAFAVHPATSTTPAVLLRLLPRLAARGAAASKSEAAGVSSNL